MRLPSSAGAVLAMLCLVGSAGLSGCGGDDTDEADKGESPAEVLAAAKTALDQTPGLHLLLRTDALPDGVSGVVEADGVGTHAPAFQGTIKVFYSGINADVPVISVGGVVYAKLPFTASYADVDPEDYGAPDPARLMDPADGISPWLTDVAGVKAGGKVRDGAEILTTYSGTLAGDSVDSAIPSADADGDFDASFVVADDGRLRSAKVTGPFYSGKPELTYTLTFTDYGTDAAIKAP